MRILFLTTDVSYPPIDGRMLRTYNVLKGIAGRHSVHLVCFDQLHGEDPRERRRVAEEQLSGLCASVDVCEVPSKRTRTGFAWAAISSFFGPMPFSTRSYWTPAVLQRLGAVAAAYPLDMIHVENTLLGSHVGHIGRTARVLVHHNVESDLFFQRATAERRPFHRAFLRLEGRKMRNFERRVGPRFGAHISCSDKDAQRLGQIMGNACVCVVPNGVDLQYFAPGPPREGESLGAVHIGGLNWSPNLQGAAWLVDEVWPLVLRTLPNATLTFVGRPGDAPVARWQSTAGIKFMGEVPDVRPFFAEAAVSVVPLHIGGGTRLKILNAWAMGTPVVSTTKGSEGLPARTGENLLIADTPAAFAASVVRMLREPKLRAQLRATARRLVEAEYGWDSIVTRTEGAYAQALQHGSVQTCRP